MKNLLQLSSVLLFLACSPSVFSQNILITYQKSDALFVCGTDTFFVQVKNTGSTPLTMVALRVALPTGVNYQPGTISGATEQNIADPNAPVFSMANLAPGATASTAFLLTADCAAADALDAGLTFYANLQVSSLQDNAALPTTSFSIETGLLLIDSVDHILLSGTKGDTLFRKIWVHNTRLGKIGALHFEDAHQPGLEVALPNANSQTLGNLFSSGEYSGSFFAGFGNGDNWLDFGETACFTERIIITDCGIPAFSNASILRVGWGCGGELCRYDSLLVNTMIETFTKIPDLKFTPIWAPPYDNCANVTSTMRLKIKNVGGAAAENLLINMKSIDLQISGMDPNSFRTVIHGDTLPFVPSIAVPQTLQGCGPGFASAVSLTIPQVPAQDSMEILFDTYYCISECNQVLGAFVADYFYRKRCPEDGFVSDTLGFKADPGFFVSPTSTFVTGSCLQDGETYPLHYSIKSKRLKQSTGILHIDLTIPWGLSLDPACALQLGGVVPTSVSSNGLPGHPTSVRLAFQLPLTSDSMATNFCLKYNCRDSMDCQEPPAIILPPSGGEFVIDADPSNSCHGHACYLPMKLETYWSLTMNTPVACSLGSCEEFKIAVEPCNDVTPGGNGDTTTICCDTLPGSKYVWGFKSYRINLGLPDQNDDRTADATGLTNAPGLRRDRFLPGDTLRVEYTGYVTHGGGFKNFGRVIWNEIVRSDMGGPMQNDAFTTKVGQHRFVNADSFQYVREMIRVRYANGMVASCEIDDQFSKSDQHYFSLNLINTHPPVKLDELVSQRHIFKTNLEDLYNDGCLPKPTLDAGDSIFFYTDFRIRCNMAPQSSNDPDPPLVGFRTALSMTSNIFAWNNIPSDKNQYSGYKIGRQMNLIGIKPCENSITVRPFRYRLRIARANMFPYEVRPLSHILDYVQTFPKGLQVESARLLYLALQDSTPRLANLPLTFTAFDSTVHVSFDPAFAEPVDEGFSMGAKVQFFPDCHFDLPDTSHQIITYQTAPGFAEPDIFSFDYRNGLGFYANRPHISFLTADTIVYMPTGDFTLHFSLKDVVAPSAPNMWLSIVSPSGQAQDFVLQQISPPLTLTAVNGVYQLNQINGFSQLNYVLQGKNTACDQDTLLMVFGWDCAPLNDINQSFCYRDTFPIELRLQSPELELDITQQPSSLPLCTQSDYFEFEVFNAKTGYAIEPTATVQLPSGLSMVPGSCQISYPVGSPFVSIADPQILPGNAYQWILNDLQPTIAAAGLPGVNLDPQNALRIRFRALAECGFVSNAQPFFGTTGRSSCGRETNVLNKPGSPLLVNGLSAGYGVTMNLQAVDNQSVFCGGMQKFQLAMTLGGTPSPNDSIYLILPVGTTLLPGSYLPQQNAPLGPPVLFADGFRLPLPTNAGPGTVVQFQFSVSYGQMVSCVNQNLVAQTRVRSEAYCASLGMPCTVYIATGEASATISLQHPELALATAALQLDASNQTNAVIVVNNIGTIPASGVVAQIWQDVDGDGTLSTGDVLLQTLNNGQPLSPGGSLQLSAAVNFNTAEVCHLLVVLPALDNCACSDRVLAIQQTVLQHALIKNCVIEAVTIGIPAENGATYEWQTTAGILCTICATTTFQPPANVQPGQSQVLLLEEKRGDCTVLHRFEIQFGAVVSISLNNPVICEGQSATLNALPAGATYQWQGPGISNPSTQQQAVHPVTTAIYTVTAVFPGGCSSTASATVTVLAKDSTYLLPLTTCQGVPVVILDKTTAVAGLYSQHLQQVNGCDSVIFQELKVLPKPQTTESASFCTGDSLFLTQFDTLVTQSGTLCRTYSAANGCDSVHCISISKLPPPAVNPGDTLIYGQIGQPIAIIGPSGAIVQYVWQPTVAGCNSCSTLNVQVDSAGIYQYLVTVTDTHGCETSVGYRLVVFPPCDPQRIQIPNAFTPNGDGLNDTFKPVDFEGAEVIASLTIYNRWGEKVYEHQGATFWDGTIDGKPAMSDVYVYIIEVACGTDKVKRVGEVSVLR